MRNCEGWGQLLVEGNLSIVSINIDLLAVTLTLIKEARLIFFLFNHFKYKNLLRKILEITKTQFLKYFFTLVLRNLSHHGMGDDKDTSLPPPFIAHLHFRREWKRKTFKSVL